MALIVEGKKYLIQGKSLQNIGDSLRKALNEDRTFKIGEINPDDIPQIYPAASYSLDSLTLGNEDFTGNILMAKVYSSVMSEDEIAANYKNLLSPPTAEPSFMVGETGYEDFNEALTAALNDSNKTMTIMPGAHEILTTDLGLSGITITGKPGTVVKSLIFEGGLTNVIIKNIEFNHDYNKTETMGSLFFKSHMENLRIQNCHFTGEDVAIYQTYDVNNNKLKNLKINTIIDGCLFEIQDSGDKCSGIVFNKMYGDITIRNNIFLKVPHNAIQLNMASAYGEISHSISIINNTFIEIGSRNVNLHSFSTSGYAGTLTVYGNTFSVPTAVEEGDKGNFVRLKTSAFYYPIGENYPAIPEDEDETYYYHLGDATSGITYDVSTHIDNAGLEGYLQKTKEENPNLLIDIGYTEDGKLCNVVDGTIFDDETNITATKYPIGGLFLNFSGEQKCILSSETIKNILSKISTKFTIETLLKLENVENTIYPFYNLTDDDQGFCFFISPSDGATTISFGTNLDKTQYLNVQSSAAPPLNSNVYCYYYLVVSYDGEYLHLYVNGEEIRKRSVYYNTSDTDYIYNARHITEYQFQDNIDLINVVLPQTISIEIGAFQGCSNLRVADISKAKYLSNNVFKDCVNLKYVYANEALWAYQWAFRNCQQITEIELPKIKTVGNSVFYDCISLERVSLPEAISIGDTCFGKCAGLKSVNIPKATVIYNSAFYKCTALESLDLPNLTDIRNGAFMYCKNLKALKIGYEKTNTVCTMNGDPFSSLTTIPTIYVHADLVDDYKAAPGWINYADYITSIENA